MSGIFPDQLNGGVPICSPAAGSLLPVPSVVNGYCPPSTFTVDCVVTALPTGCTANPARWSAAQTNAFQSEMLALAAAFCPDGSWDCCSNTNLAANFEGFLAKQPVHLCGPTSGIPECDSVAPGSSYFDTDCETWFVNLGGCGCCQWVDQTNVAAMDINVLDLQYGVDGPTTVTLTETDGTKHLIDLADLVDPDATLVNNNNGTFTWTSGDGATIHTFCGACPTVTNNGNGTLTFDPGTGGPTTTWCDGCQLTSGPTADIPACGTVQLGSTYWDEDCDTLFASVPNGAGGCVWVDITNSATNETTTILGWDPVTGTLTYTNETGAVVNHNITRHEHSSDVNPPATSMLGDTWWDPACDTNFIRLNDGTSDLWIETTH